MRSVCCFPAPWVRNTNILFITSWRSRWNAHRFIEAMDSSAKTRRMDPQLEHILISGMFSAFFEIVIHNMPMEQATEYVKELRDLYVAGWKKIMGL